MKPLISEKIEIKDTSKIFKYLCANSVSTDIKLFSEYYLSKEVDGEIIKLLCPIKFESYRKFYYWNGKKWIPDMDGYFVSKTLSDNLQRLYLRHNRIKNSTDNMEKIFENQKYINSMNSEKYKRLLIKEIRSLINAM